MPFSELFGASKMTKADSPQPYGPDDDCFHELVWENGQIVMQGQSSRSKKESNLDNPRSLVPKTLEGNNSSNPKMEKFGTTDAMMTDFTSLVPSYPEGLDKYDDFVPLFNFSADEPLSNDSFSEFLSELSGVTGNDIPRVNSLVSTEKRSSLSYLSRDVHTSSVTNAISLGKEPISQASSNAVEPDGHGKRQEFPQHTTPRLGNPGFANNNTSDTRLLMHDEGQPNNNFGFLNFRSLSRPAAAARVSHKNPGTATGSVPYGAEMLRTKDKGCSVSCRHLNEQNLFNFRNSSSWKDMPPISQPLFGSGKQDRLSSLTSHHTQELPPDNQSHASCQIITDKIDELPCLVTTAMGAEETVSDQKNGEPAGTTSSVCSGSSVEKTSDDPKLGLKRKAHETGELESPSEEAEEESVGVRKAAPARPGSKRSRAAEVHNLSERRRRDRINEKMRALQELIPNCNKADKASMLDDAIEYLKSLKHQEQMLSMGGGLYMPPPMMLPGGMHHIHGAHMPYFTPMGIGMGMGCGMNMFSMNGDMMQTHAAQAPHYPFYGTQVTRPSNFLGMMGTTSLQTFGHPQGKLPVSAPCAPPVVPFSGGSPQNLPVGLNVSGMTGPANGSNLAPPTSSRDAHQ